MGGHGWRRARDSEGEAGMTEGEGMDCGSSGGLAVATAIYAVYECRILMSMTKMSEHMTQDMVPVRVQRKSNAGFNFIVVISSWGSNGVGRSFHLPASQTPAHVKPTPSPQSSKRHLSSTHITPYLVLRIAQPSAPSACRPCFATCNTRVDKRLVIAHDARIC